MPERNASHRVYAIALDKTVLRERRFVAANPQYVPGKPCVYVGMTGLPPDERFRNHREGRKASKFVKKYGRYLRRRLYENIPPMSYEQAQKKEVELAEDLRRKGYAVWQR